MTKEGIVAKSENSTLTVLIKTQNACDACRAECGGHCDKAKLEAIEVENTLGAEKGDKVLIYSETKRIMLYAFCVFVLPIVLTIISGIVFFALTSSPLFTFISCITAFFVSFTLVRLIFKNTREKDIYKLLSIIK